MINWATLEYGLADSALTVLPPIASSGWAQDRLASCVSQSRAEVACRRRSGPRLAEELEIQGATQGREDRRKRSAATVVDHYHLQKVTSVVEPRQALEACSELRGAISGRHYHRAD